MKCVRQNVDCGVELFLEELLQNLEELWPIGDEIFSKSRDRANELNNLVTDIKNGTEGKTQITILSTFATY